MPKSETHMTPGQLIRQQRQARGWTQVDLAARLAEIDDSKVWTQPVVAFVEKTENPRLSTLLPFVRLGFDLRALLAPEESDG